MDIGEQKRVIIVEPEPLEYPDTEIPEYEPDPVEIPEQVPAAP